MIVFIAQSHTYWHLQGKGDKQKITKFHSVGSHLHKFQPDYDTTYWLTYKAFQLALGEERFKEIKQEHFPGQSKPAAKELFEILSDQCNVSKFFYAREKLEHEWDVAREFSAYRGTKFHDKMEKRSIRKGYEPHFVTGEHFPCVKVKKEYDNQSLCDNLYELEDGFYPELLIFNKDLQIAGQADKVFIETVDAIRYVDIDDYKTNKDSNLKKSFGKLLPPWDHLPNSKLFRYNLQISFYAYMMELFGFKARHLALTHVKDYNPNKGTVIMLDYLKDEIQNSLNWE